MFTFFSSKASSQQLPGISYILYTHTLTFTKSTKKGFFFPFTIRLPSTLGTAHRAFGKRVTTGWPSVSTSLANPSCKEIQPPKAKDDRARAAVSDELLGVNSAVQQQ